MDGALDLVDPTGQDAAQSTPASRLSWSLTICTYNRPHFLLPMVGYVAQQTRLPREVVIVDASDDWQDSKAALLAAYPEFWETVTLTHVPAKVRAVAYQRNQALDLTSGDIVFSLDDDIYLYPDTADTIMRIYEADPEQRIAMVGALFADLPPEAAQEDDSAVVDSPAPGLKQRLRSWLEAQMTLDRHFVPYGKPVDRSPLEELTLPVRVFATGLINGGRMTFRRGYGVQTRWSELLRYYATHEDSDFSYRMSAHGRLVTAPDARLFHADGNERVLKPYRVNLIRVRNMMALTRVSSARKPISALKLMRSFLKYAALYALIDPIRKRFTLPTVRAYLYGALQVPFFLFAPIRDFKSWYIALQERMYQTR
ncbi:glycosyltransferase family 2 protein [Cognatishimia sp. SS12]|uniref:glycosyltransferase family 2 protein n=1 Tax=Cognatishimia sp. SS12 TaxID=2979465 RepID=UPI00232D2FD5|nr:glycosyltransferase family 2 protein [Cognatishimia sp. SS12]MDC0738713.1 glycosyltransferase family 2 protein [Cognatishimia sp. SS12]